MSGAGLVTIKRRIKSVVNTKKITKAMGLVATAKLRKARVSLTKTEEYNKEYSSLFNDVIENYDGSSTFIRGNKSKKRLFIVYTSESGLCGGYNASVANKVNEFVKGNKENILIFVVGQKGRSYFKRMKYETAAEYVEVPDLPSLKEIKEISQHALSIYEKGEAGELYVVYTKFETSVKQEVKIEKLLPINVDNKRTNNDYIDFEPDIESSFEHIVKEYIKQQLYYTLISSKASEHSARMNAMDGATKNADDIIDKLNLKFNRIRQSSITQEISEIVGGAEAQK